MTVTTELSRSTHPWTGVETSFAPGFSADREEDVLVFFRTVAGTQSLLTPGVNHSVALASETKIITVTPIALPASTGTVVVIRDTPALVEENLVDGEEFSLEVIQQLHDRAAMRSAEDRVTLDRAITLPETAEAGVDNYDLGGSGLSNVKPGTAPTDAATVGQIQEIVAGSGNVPAPVLSDVGKLIVATAEGVFGWVALGLSHIANGLFTANAAGRAKFGAGFVDTSLLADGALSNDAAGRAKMADGFLAATSAGRAKMGLGFFSADAAGRSLMDDGFVTFDELAAAAKAFGMPVNLGLAASVAGNALTISLTDAAGAAPSAASPVLIPFRSDTPASGATVLRQVTAATTLVISSGSTMGFVNATAGRLWIVAFDDGGTVRLGAINCRKGVNIFKLAQAGIAASTAEGGAGAADLAQVFYTGAAVAAKAYAVLGYLEWGTGLAAAGTWASGPTLIERFRPGMKLPGDVVQSVVAELNARDTTTSAIPLDDTMPQITEGKQAVATDPMSPSSAANVLRIASGGEVCNDTAGTAVVLASFRSDSNDAVAATAVVIAQIGYYQNAALSRRILAGSASALTFSTRYGVSGGTGILNGNTARQFGASQVFVLEVEEIMA